MDHSLLNIARSLQHVPPEAAAEYERQKGVLLEEVNRAFNEHPDKTHLLGPNPSALIENNHLNHVMFMSSIFRLNQFELLAKVIPWVYRAYHTKGVSYDYFPFELEAWIESIRKHITVPGVDAILAVYAWMISNHDRFVHLAKSHELVEPALPENAFIELKERFLVAILTAKTSHALEIAKKTVPSHDHLESFFMNIVQPAMYDIGRKWELGEVSVAQEHLASSIVSRIMSGLYTTLTKPSVSRGRAVVTAAPNEYHELGPWMVSDLLELDGWEIAYLGANTPPEALLDMVRSVRPFLLAISVTMPFNLERAADIIASVRKDASLRETKVLVGGIVFNTLSHLWKQIGADGYAANAKDAVLRAKTWWDARSSA